MTKQQARQLLQRYRMGQCNPEEKKIVESWIEQELVIGNWARTAEEKSLFGQNLKAKIDQALQLNTNTPPVFQGMIYRKLWMKISIAAAVLLLPAFFLLHAYRLREQLHTADIIPGKNAATLTLANGRKILLSASTHGKLANEAGVRISKTAAGQLRYEIIAADSLDENGRVLYNTLTTALGQQYQVLLPDGTNVWLNNGSSLKYPVCFSRTKKRKVELMGEGYFEVAKNAGQPFIVHMAQQEITVLGTHFNVNGYENEPELKTTLLEGSVQITAHNHKQLIKPGEQAIVTDQQLRIKTIDPELAIAWKNNLFMFESEGIESIMRRIERWYNVRVEYIGEIPADKFGGEVSRFGNVSELLHVLELTGKVHFKLDGRRIMVSK